MAPLRTELNFTSIKGEPNWGGEIYSEMPRVEFD